MGDSVVCANIHCIFIGEQLCTALYLEGTLTITGKHIIIIIANYSRKLSSISENFEEKYESLLAWKMFNECVFI